MAAPETAAKAARAGSRLGDAFTGVPTVEKPEGLKQELLTTTEELTSAIEEGLLSEDEISESLDIIAKAKEKLAEERKVHSGERAVLPQESFQVKSESIETAQEAAGLQPGQESPALDTAIGAAKGIAGAATKAFQTVSPVLGKALDATGVAPKIQDLTELNVRGAGAIVDTIRTPRDIPERIEAFADIFLAGALREGEAIAEFGAQVAETALGDVPFTERGLTQDPLSSKLRTLQRSSPLDPASRARALKSGGTEELAYQERLAGYAVNGAQGTISAMTVLFGPEDVAIKGASSIIGKAAKFGRFRKAAKVLEDANFEKALDELPPEPGPIGIVMIKGEPRTITPRKVVELGNPSMDDAGIMIETAAARASRGDGSKFFDEVHHQIGVVKGSMRRAYQNNIDDALEAGELTRAQDLGVAMDEQLRRIDDLEIQIRDRHATGPILVDDVREVTKPLDELPTDEFSQPISKVDEVEDIEIPDVIPDAPPIQIALRAAEEFTDLVTKLRETAQVQTTMMAEKAIKSGRDVAMFENVGPVTDVIKEMKKKATTFWATAKMAQKQADTVEEQLFADNLHAAARSFLDYMNKIFPKASEMTQLAQDVAQGDPERLLSRFPIPVRTSTVKSAVKSPAAFKKWVFSNEAPAGDVQNLLASSGLEKKFLETLSKGRRPEDVPKTVDEAFTASKIFTAKKKNQLIKRLSVMAKEAQTADELDFIKADIADIKKTPSAERVNEFFEQNFAALQHPLQHFEDLPPSVKELNELTTFERFDRFQELRRKFDQIPGIENMKWQDIVDKEVDEMLLMDDLRHSIIKHNLPGSSKGGCF